MKPKRKREQLRWRQGNFDAMCEQLNKTAMGAELVRKGGVTRPGSLKK